jgi:hypothetical protein
MALCKQSLQIKKYLTLAQHADCRLAAFNVKLA